jgi:hypothetical protein
MNQQIYRNITPLIVEVITINFCDTVSKYANSFSLFAALISILIVSAFSGHYLFNLPGAPAFAHITKQIGNIKVEVGWSDEPPLTGQVNNIIVAVNKTSASGRESAIINALADLDIKERYGSITKSVDFIPSEQAEGVYESKIIPTRVGSYSLVMNGTIQGEKLSNVEIPLDLVEGTQKISFPDTSGSNTVTSGVQAASNNIGPKLQTIISGISNDVGSSKSDIQLLAKNMANIQKSALDMKNSVDRLYLIAMLGIGAGIAGIIIAAASLSRKQVFGLH